MIGPIFALVIAAGQPPVMLDPHPPTGVINPAVTQATIGSTICKRDWTKTVRPPASYTNKLKRADLPPGTNLRLWELDHILPIEDGGSPTDPNNLRPQPWAGPDGATVKDQTVEDPTKRDICAGRIILIQGQQRIAAWIVAHHPYPIIPSH